MNDLPLLDFGVNGCPFLLKDRHAVLGARSADNVAALQHPVDGVLHICVRVEL